jgi:hypothetical protein
MKGKGLSPLKEVDEEYVMPTMDQDHDCSDDPGLGVGVGVVEGESRLNVSAFGSGWVQGGQS